MDYATIKLVHQSAVTLSIVGFFARGLASLANMAWVRSRAARTLPHVVDTVLLGSAIALAWVLQQAFPDREVRVLETHEVDWSPQRMGAAARKRLGWDDAQG